jgi:uncharacterized protein (TIGR02246 family)
VTNRLTTFATVAVAAFALAATVAAQQPDDDKAVRAVLTRFYDGWDAHDIDKMVSTYADDVDHINVFGEWHKGKAEIRQDLTLLHNGPARPGPKVPSFEKIRFIGSNVAVVQVLSKSPLGLNLGTYVLEKRSAGWLIVSFTNVMPTTPPYKKK